MTTIFSKFRALSRAERTALLSALLMLPLFSIGLHVFGLPRFNAWLERAPIAARPYPTREQLARIATLIRMAGNRVPVASTCLTRSLLLGWWLRRRGVRGELRIGVRLSGGKFEAHAWLEYGGRPLNDSDDIAMAFAAFDEPLSYKSFS